MSAEDLVHSTFYVIKIYEKSFRLILSPKSEKLIFTGNDLYTNKHFDLPPCCYVSINLSFTSCLLLFLFLSPLTFIIAGSPRGNYREFQTVGPRTCGPADSAPTITLLLFNCCGLNRTHTLRSTRQLKISAEGRGGVIRHTLARTRVRACVDRNQQESTGVWIRRMLSTHAYAKT